MDFSLDFPNQPAHDFPGQEQRVSASVDAIVRDATGTYGFVPDSKVFFNPTTNNIVVLDKIGNFVTGFKLEPNAPQFENYVKNGVIR